MTLLSVPGAIAALGPLARSTADIDSYVDECLDAFLAIGFRRARYYLRTADLLAEPSPIDYLYLVRSRAHAGRDIARVKPGLSIPLADSTLGRGESLFLPTVASDFRDQAGSVKSDWVRKLGLTGHSWVDIPIHDGRNMIGLLAADWLGPPHALSASARLLLGLLGRYMGTNLRNETSPLEAVIKQQLEASYEDANLAPSTLAATVTDAFGKTLEVGTASLFRFNPSAQTLTRIHMFVHPSRSAQRPAPAEVYGVGQHLTGRAWVSEDWRRVADFETAQARDTSLVALPSMAWHKELLGKVQTVAYGVVGDREPRYLVRLVNSVPREDLPFFHEYDVLTSVVSEFASVIDSRITTVRESALRTFNRLAASRPPIATLLQATRSDVTQDGIDGFAILAHRDPSSRLTFRYATTPQAARHLSTVRGEWARDDLYTRMVRRTDPTIELCGPSRPGVSDDGEATTVIAHSFGAAALVGIPFSSGLTHGVLLLPVLALPPAAANSTSEARPNGPQVIPWSVGVISSLQSYASIIGHAIENEFVTEQANGALKALGLVGHEMATPVSSLGSYAELALIATRNRLREFDDDASYSLDSFLKNCQAHIETIHESVNSSLELGRLVARDEHSRLHCEYRAEDLRTTINTALRQVKKEPPADATMSLATFEVGPSIAQLGTFVHDPGHIRSCLLNLLRNGAKYSLPRNNRSRPLVQVTASPQRRWTIIAVRNWGHAIPEDRREIIFEPFVRGQESDARLARRGMGLGLYLARRIAQAHGGDVVLRPQRRVEASESGTQSIQVYETTFELMLPDNLAPGVLVFDFSIMSERQIPRVAAAATR